MTFNLVFVFLVIVRATSAEFPSIPDSHLFESRDTDGTHRLPSNTIPTAYDVSLEPLFEPDFTFAGSVTILIDVIEDTDTITLHAHELTINVVTVTHNTGTFQSSYTLNEDLQFIIIILEQIVTTGTQLTVYIQYEGVLNESNEGFYRASYEEDGETKWFATTQFQATSARQAFPCYDEPALKARFTIHIIRPEPYNSISNMNLLSSVEGSDGKYTDTFEETVLMSTYLVAFVVSELAFVEEGSQRVYGVPQLILEGRGAYGLQAGIDILAEMIDFTTIEYSLDKLYQVSIPDGYFQAGAMENWGLVTYRDRYLLYSETLSTSLEKQYIVSIIAHELGHQWFGNLVSPSWWEYLWLNEGFATYFEYYATSVVEPDMHMMEQFVIGPLQNAMVSDALPTSRPMSYDAQTPAEINSLFDRIAYDKSGAVIRMMENFLTTDIFKRGLTIYLNDRAYDSATPSDLWAGLQAAVTELNPDQLADLTVAEIMETWNSQAGYPVVTAERIEGQIRLTQSRFLINEASHELDNTWTVPINYVISSNPDFTDTTATYWLQGASEDTSIEVGDDEWIILNKQETGYYRVNYDEDNWNLIIDQLKSEEFDQIHSLNRAQLIDDAMNLARSGRLPYSIVLNLLQYLSSETNYMPLYSFFRNLGFLNKHLLHSEHYDSFKLFVREILQTASEQLGTEESEDHTENLNRINVLTWLCRYDDESCLEAMNSKLSSFQLIHPDLQQLVYCNGLAAETGLSANWLYMYGRYLSNNVEYLEANRIASAFGCARQELHLIRLLNMIVDEATLFSISDAHKTAAFAGIISSSEIGLQTAFDFILNNFGAMELSLTQSQISTMLSGISDRLTTEAQKTQLEELLSSLTTDLQEKHSSAFETALANIQNNIDWADQHLTDITDWLSENYNIDDDPGTGFIFSISIPLLIIALLSHIL